MCHVIYFWQLISGEGGFISPKNGPRNSRYATGSCIKHFNPPFNPPLNTLPVKAGFFFPSKKLLLQKCKDSWSGWHLKKWILGWYPSNNTTAYYAWKYSEERHVQCCIW